MIEINLPPESIPVPEGTTPVLAHNGKAYAITFMGVNHLGQHIFVNDEDWEALSKELPWEFVGTPESPYMSLRMQMGSLGIYIVRERNRALVPDA